MCGHCWQHTDGGDCKAPERALWGSFTSSQSANKSNSVALAQALGIPGELSSPLYSRIACRVRAAEVSSGGKPGVSNPAGGCVRVSFCDVYGGCGPGGAGSYHGLLCSWVVHPRAFWLVHPRAFRWAYPRPAPQNLYNVIGKLVSWQVGKLVNWSIGKVGSLLKCS